MPLAEIVTLGNNIKSILDNPPVVKDPVTGQVNRTLTNNAIADAWADTIAAWLSTATIPPFVATVGGPVLAKQTLKSTMIPIIINYMNMTPVPGVNNFLIGINAALTLAVSSVIIPGSTLAGVAVNANILSFSTAESVINGSILAKTSPDNSSLSNAYATDFLKWTALPGATFTIPSTPPVTSPWT